MNRSFEDYRLEFNHDSITIVDGPVWAISVMMRWETPIMKRHAEVVCHNGGDILEIGFGMGIFADFVQGMKPSSHTIVESHPQVIKKLSKWATDKSNVRIIEGKWLEKKSLLEKYDGIFYDASGDPDYITLKKIVPHIAKKNTVLSFWNNLPRRENIFGFDERVSYEKVKIDPPRNNYFNEKTYYLPTVRICHG